MMLREAEERLARLEQRFEALRRVSALIGTSTSMDEFATALVALVGEVLDAEASSLLLVEETTSELIFRAATGEKAEALAKIRLQPGEGIAGWVAEHNQWLIVDPARSDPRFCPRVDEETGFYTRSVLCVPVRGKGGVKGALEVLNPRSGRQFTSEDAELLEIIAEPVALLLENARLIEGLQRRMDELNTLIETERAVNALHDLEVLLRVILESAAQVTQAEGSSLILIDPETEQLTFYVATGEKGEELERMTIPRGQGIVGWCIEHNEVVYSPDPYCDERFLRDVDATLDFRTRSILCVPLRIGEEVIGALEVVNLPPPETFPDSRSELLQALASQAAIALERARLYQQLERKVDLANAELLRTNRKLEVEKARITAMVENMADGVILVDEGDRIILVNSAAERMFGLQREEYDGRPVSAVQQAPLREVLATPVDVPEGRELRLEEPRSRVLRVHASQVLDSAHRRLGKVIVCTDITELKELDELKTQLVSFASHELRTPLTSIKGFATVLKDNEQLPIEDQRELLNIIDHECDRLRRLVAGLLCLSRIESGRALEVAWQRVEVRSFLEQLLEVQRFYAPNHCFILEMQEERLWLEADRDKLEQIITNLLNNAVKYSDDGTTVTVQVAERQKDYLFCVEDQGYGIAREDLPYLFQPYGRLQEAQQRQIVGTGLGLYLTKHLVEAHGGSIWVESEEGRGSKFFFTLPKRVWEGETA
ncbi:MAG TPA: GAF domain-containing sensor histidine kinase [Armatimonadetes bacterium]|nr:GAF domain-containing sensor histidine kinase [Armatimonadota bacterium]